MRMEVKTVANEHSAKVEYTIHLGYYDSVFQLLNHFSTIANENNIPLDELHFTASSISGYGGDIDIELNVNIDRPATPAEKLNYLQEKEDKKRREKEHAQREIERLQKIIEAP